MYEKIMVFVAPAIVIAFFIYVAIGFFWPAVYHSCG